MSEKLLSSHLLSSIIPSKQDKYHLKTSVRGIVLSRGTPEQPRELIPQA